MAKKRQQEVSPPKGFPKALNLLSQTWDVKYVEHIDKEEWLLGACDHTEKTIYIDVNQATESQKETLLHEAVHAMFRLLPILSEEDERIEEAMVMMITTFMLSFLRSNEPFWSEE